MQNKLRNIEGKINTSAKGFGYVKNPNLEEDIYIPEGLLGTALPGDTVRIKLLPDKVEDKIAGKVIAILSRARSQFVGTVVKNNEEVSIKPDNFKIYTDFTLIKGGVENNQKVLVKFIDWKKDEEKPTVELVKIFGQKGVHEVEIQSIIYEKGFESEFPKEIEIEAEKLKKKWTPLPKDEIEKRRDLRDETVMTIDPDDAKDFDDALSVKQLDDSNYEVGIHITDVSHYVTPDTELDKEAYKRSFSVYLVDRTIPMLPEILSNDLCSLNPNEDKLAFSSIFELTPNAEVVNRWFGRTIINSKKRFTYEEAQAILDVKDGDYYTELNILNTLAKKLNKKNKSQGAIEFEKDEIKFELDENGKPLRIIKKEHLETHKLVENMMLLSNREVAKFIHTNGKKLGNNHNDLMYRVHGVPQKDKINDLATFLKALGYHLKTTDDGEITAKDLNELFEEIEGKPEETLIKTAAVRTMSKAMYSTENTGHFGLAFQFYTHFTSPIRRYPDLLVHRVVAKFLNNKHLSDEEISRLEASASLSTEQEIAAAEAERDSIKYKQAEYIQDHIGQEFEGIISGVVPWGIYVQLKDTLSEGMVHISKLGQDFFHLDEGNYQIIGEKTGKTFKLSDTVKVKIESVDLERNNINMELAG